MQEPLTPERVYEALLAYAQEELDWADFSEFTNSIDLKPGQEFDIPGLGRAILVDFHDYDQRKSYDGWSEDVWQIWEVDGVLFRIKGSHTSYEGTSWDATMTVVVPKNKTIIEYVDGNMRDYFS